MGTWGDGSFDNDAALDWLGRLEKTKKPSALIQDTFTATIKTVDEICQCQIAVGAAEVEAAFRGHPARGLPEVLVVWLETTKLRVSERRADLGVRCLSMILDDSDLRDHCGNDKKWRIRIRSLIKRLERPPKTPSKVKKQQSSQSTQVSKKEVAPTTKFAISTIKKYGAEIFYENRKPYSVFGAEKNDETYIEAISQLTMLKDLSIRLNPRDSIGNFGLLSSLTDLESVCLEGVTNEQVQFCSEFKKLKIVSFSNSKIRDACLGSIANCKRLRNLSLRDTNITNKGVKRLAGLKHLEEIDLSRTKITDAVIPVLASFPKLKMVYLQFCNIKGKQFRAINKLKKLFRLELRGSNITDQELGYLDNPTLVTLDLVETKVTGIGLKFLKQHQKLRRLIAWDSKFSDVGCQFIVGSSVAELDVRNTKITDKALPILAKCKNLKQLKIARNRISSNAVERLRATKAIRSLSFYT